MYLNLYFPGSSFIQRAILPFQPFERLLTETQRLYLEFPPSTLEKDVKERYRRYQEQMQPPSKKKRPSKTVSWTLDIFRRWTHGVYARKITMAHHRD